MSRARVPGVKPELLDRVPRLRAELLHAETCLYSHSDECPWLFEEKAAEPWEQSVHKQYLARALKGE